MSTREIVLVREGDDRHPPDSLPHAVDPGGELAKGRLTREVEDSDHPPSSAEIRVLEQLHERPTSNDIEDDHVDLRGSPSAVPHFHGFLRHDGAECPDVGVIELPRHEPPDEGRLANALVTDQTDLQLDDPRLLGGHVGPRKRETWS